MYNCKVASNFAGNIIKITLNSKKINVFRYMLCKFFIRNFLRRNIVKEFLLINQYLRTMTTNRMVCKTITG